MSRRSFFTVDEALAALLLEDENEFSDPVALDAVGAAEIAADQHSDDWRQVDHFLYEAANVYGTLVSSSKDESAESDNAGANSDVAPASLGENLQRLFHQVVDAQRIVCRCSQ